MYNKIHIFETIAVSHFTRVTPSRPSSIININILKRSGKCIKCQKLYQCKRNSESCVFIVTRLYSSSEISMYQLRDVL